MFGYVRPQKSELLVREYEQYKGIYCSLCRQLGKSYGAAARLTLSYDCTFYAMLLLSLNPECPGFHTGRCMVNPLKKCSYCNAGENELVMASALSVLMTYHKIRDDIADSGFFGKLRGYLLLPIASGARKKAARDFPELDSIVSDAMKRQEEAERNESPGIDLCADPTANMLCHVFELAAGEEDASKNTQARVLNQIGYYLGRWVYLIDAADDMEKDLKSKSFNPFVLQFQLNQNSTEADLGLAREKANQVLNMTLSRLIAAFHILEVKHFSPILENIIERGLSAIQKELLFKEEKTNVRSL